MWYVGERVAAKPYGNGDLNVICSIYRVENEQDWKSVQFISTTDMLIICKLFMYIVENEIHIFLLYLNRGLGDQVYG